MTLRRETWDTNPSTEENQFFCNGWSSFDCFDQNSLPYLPNSSSGQELPQSYNDCYPFNEIYGSLLDKSSPQIIDSYYTTLDTPFNTLCQEDYPLPIMEEEDPGMLGEELKNLELQATCKAEPTQSSEMPVFNMGTGLERKNRSKKLQGQPSKNLMAERRRRKRLNDRLSMLRAIVPKISKVCSECESFIQWVLLHLQKWADLICCVECLSQMDRTSILGDTIDYMKELLEKINNLQQEGELESKMAGIFKDVKPNEILVRNSPKVWIFPNRLKRINETQLCNWNHNVLWTCNNFW